MTAEEAYSRKLKEADMALKSILASIQTKVEAEKDLEHLREEVTNLQEDLIRNGS